ncbi:MAG: VWA domain-containing protein [Candidatus Schekmanbacteria bacterium]|nr:VWA domain-containing protein [Candidatus Schekmanbacteria bacterium]
MQFENLNYLYALWLIPGLIFFYAFAFKAKDQALGAFCSPKMLARLTPQVSRARQKVKAALIIFAILMLIIALAGPKWGFHWEDVQRRGVDVVIALDVSRSMLAEDVKPSRLERAKREIFDLLSAMEGDRVGLVAFAGTSFVQCPLTLDYNAAGMFLDYLDTDLIPVPGTNLGHAIRNAIKVFGEERTKSKALILITDGESHEADTLEAAQEAQKEGIRIFAIGIGQEGGAPIPVKDGLGGFRKDKSGDMIITRLDEATLQKIALLTGGSYVRSVTGNMDLDQIYFKGIKKTLEEKELKGTRIKRRHERFYLFALLAFVLLVWEALLPETKKVKKL